MSLDSQGTSAMKKVSRRGLYLPVFALLILGLAWTGLWFYGRSKVSELLDQFFLNQAKIGRNWSCPERSISGYPFRIELRCKQPTYSMNLAPNHQVRGSLGALTVIATTAGAFNLAHVIGEFDAPLVVEDSQIGKKTSQWKTARASFRGHANRLERVSVEIDAPRTTVDVNGSAAFQSSAEKIEFHLAEAGDEPAGGAYNIALDVSKANIPPADMILNSTDPVDFIIQGRLLKLTGIDRQNWQQSIENWRLGGGTMRVDVIKLQKGLPRVEAKGDLRLDETRRLSGRLDANFVNAEALLQQFGIGGGGGGGLLGAILGGGRPQAGGQAGQPRPERVMRLPLVIENGRVGVGPFRIPGFQMKPIY
jgi:hypothetical protein